MPDDVVQIAFEALDKGLSKKIDDIGGKLDQLEGKVDTSAESFRSWDNVLDKSFDHVGTSAADVSKKLESLGAATTDAAKVQHELERAQNDVIASAQKLAEAQQALARNTDPSKHAELKREVSAAQVSLDSAATSVKKYSDEINRMSETTAKTQSGFSKLQAGIVTANQALELVQRGFGYVKTVVDETIGSTLEYAKQVRDLSTNLGITAEETSKIIQASDDYGISVESVTGALQMAVKRGFAPNIETLAKLADEYNSIQSPTERAARLTEVFGRGWTSLTPILKAGGQAIREAADEAAKLGLVLSDKDVQAARALEIQVDNLNDRVNALKLKMGKDLIPDVINVVDVFNQFGDVLQGTADPLDEMNRRIGYAITFQGENSEEVARLRAEYERLKNAIKDVAMTAGERLLRSNMAQIGISAQLRTGFLGINEAAKEQYGIYQNLTEAEKRLIGLREQSLALNRAHNAQIADAYSIAITYTESQRKQADVQKELDNLNAKIASRGPVRVATVAAETKATTELTASQSALSAARAAADDVAKRDNESSAQYAMRLKDAQTNLKKLTEQMGSHIPVVNALSATDQKSALNQAKLAAAQEDLATAQKKKGETDAEFALRVETIKSKIADYSKTLEAHTGVVGGATKAELEQKKALEEQIATLQKADEVERAKGAFNSLTEAFRAGTLTQGQYEERAAALNRVTGLYTESALKQATAQETLMKAFADPRGVEWYTQLVMNKDAIDGVVAKTGEATKATENLSEAQGAHGEELASQADKATAATKKVGEASIEAAQRALDFKNKNETAAKKSQEEAERLAQAHGAAARKISGENEGLVTSYKAVADAARGISKEIAPAVVKEPTDEKARIAARDKAIQDSETSSKKAIGSVSSTAKTATGEVTNAVDATDKKLTALATTTQAKFITASTSVQNAMRIMASTAGIDLFTVYQAVDKLPTFKEFVYQITVKGEVPRGLPGGAQYGADFIVPANPRGGAGDYFPILAAPGERVTVQTKAQQNAVPAPVQSGDTFIYNTNVYNPLAAAMLADKQRRDRLARSNARMGVT